MGFGFEIERWNASLLRPRFGLTLGWATGDISDERANASLQRWSLRAHLRPLDLLQTRTVNLRPCARIDAGYVYVHLENANPLYLPDDSFRRDMVRVSPYLEFVLAPQPDVEIRLDGGLDLLALRSTVTIRYDEGRWLSHVPHGLGAYAAMSVAVKY